MTGHRATTAAHARRAWRGLLAVAFVFAAASLHAEPPPETRALPPVVAPSEALSPAEATKSDPAVTKDAAPRSIGQTTGPIAHDLSPWSMFLNADILVKGVMVGLALASVLTWTIFLAKSVELLLAKAGLTKALKRLAGAETVADGERAMDGRQTVLSRLVAAIADEARISQHSSQDIRASSEGIKERAASRCSEIVKAEGRIARRGMGALATIGAISPFVGLFGTVWGIMNSFIGISKAQTTNLAVVAPGIAEALLATAIGLVAAIPAVIIYNHFARATRGYGDLVQRASGTAMRLLSRDLDRGAEAGRPHGLPRAAE